MLADIICIIHGIRRCNIVFMLESFFLGGGGGGGSSSVQWRKLKEAEDFKCVFVAYCVLESK